MSFLSASVHDVQFALVSLLIAFLLGAGLRACWRSRFWREMPKNDLIAVGCCLLLAVILRLNAATFPADGQLASSQGVIISGVHRWAAGFSVILHLLFLFLPGNVATVAKLNVVVSAATVLILFAFVEAYFEDRFAAFSAAAVLACSPVPARYAASDSPYVLLTFCLFSGCLFLTLWSGDRRRLTLYQGVGWLALAANIRFEAVIFPLVGALVLAGRAKRLADIVRTDVRDAVVFGMIFLAYPLREVLAGLASHEADTFAPFGFLGIFFFDKLSMKIVCAAAVAGLLWALTTRFRRALCFLAALVVVSFPTVSRAYDHYDLAYRYVLPHLAAWSVFAGIGFSAAWILSRGGWRRIFIPGAEAAMRRIPPFGAAAVLIVVLCAAAPHRRFLSKMWTYALEYEFVAGHLGAIPESCVMVMPDPGDDPEMRGLRISAFLSAEAGQRHRWILADELGEGLVEPCTVFYRAARCFGFETLRHKKQDWDGAERPVCRRVSERFQLEPIAVARIPSIPYFQEGYSVNPIPIGFYRLRPKAALSLAE